MDPLLLHAAIALTMAVAVLLIERWAYRHNIRVANANRLRHLILTRKVRG